MDQSFFSTSLQKLVSPGKTSVSTTTNDVNKREFKNHPIIGLFVLANVVLIMTTFGPNHHYLGTISLQHRLAWDATSSSTTTIRERSKSSFYAHVSEKWSTLLSTTMKQPGTVGMNHKDIVPVKPNDYIYAYEFSNSDKAPIVIESHKLVFFTVAKVGCTVWKKLFRRMMGYSNWMSASEYTTHDNGSSGLKFLWDYNISMATQLMNDPTWTKAIFVRDPKDRFLSAYLDKAVATDYFKRHCCKECQGPVGFEKFINYTQSRCKNDNHWIPQDKRIDQKFWKKIQFVGHLESAEADAERLLKRIGAWEEFGANGWGKRGKMFAAKDVIEHATAESQEGSRSRLALYYTPELESRVETIVNVDYANPILNLSQYKIPFESIIMNQSLDHV